MSQSHEPVIDAQQVVRYLLHQLPEEETERFDEAGIVDNEFAARLREIENDLVDAYVSGTLDVATRRLFETVYLVSPLRRQKVDSAKHFLAVIEREAATTGTRASSPSRGAWRARSRIAWPLVAAASFLLACSVFFFTDRQWSGRTGDARREMAGDSRRTQTLDHQLDREGPAGAIETDKPGSTSSTSSLREQNPAGVITSAEPPAPRIVAQATMLFPQTRALQPLTSIAVGPDARDVAFELRLESKDFPRYQAVLQDPGQNRVLWRSAVVRSRSAAGIATVSIVVPAGLLGPQHYVIELTGLGVAGRGDLVGTYAFQVDR